MSVSAGGDLIRAAGKVRPGQVEAIEEGPLVDAGELLVRATRRSEIGSGRRRSRGDGDDVAHARSGRSATSDRATRLEIVHRH